MTSAAPWSGYVLIVEAVEETRETLVRVLLGSGYHVAAAGTGAEAVECIRAGPAPCLILFDPAEPMADGDLVLAERASGVSIGLTPMVLLGVGRASELAAAARAVDCLLKPIDLGLLMQVVQRYCRPASSPSGPNGGHDRGLSIGTG